MGIKTKVFGKSSDKKIGFYDSVSGEITDLTSSVLFYDDFIGADIVIPAAAESGEIWQSKTVETLGSPAVAGIAGGNGLVQLSLDATDEAESAVLYMADRLLFNVRYGLVFEARVAITVTPTDVAECVWGLAGTHSDAPDDITYSAWFKADGSTAVVVEMDDNATDTDDTATAVVAGTTTYRNYRIDFSNYSLAKFSIDGVPVANTTTFAWVAIEANSLVQPYFSLYKASGVGVCTMVVDHVRIFQNRS